VNISSSGTLPNTTPLLPANHMVQRCPTSRREAPQRILIVKFGALGDILMATPLLTALRRAYPEAYLTWLVEDKNAQAIDANPFIDEIMLWDSSQWSLMRSTRPRNWVKNRFGLRWLNGLARLNYHLKRRFDTVITFHPEHWQFLLDAVAPKISVGVFQSSGEQKRDYISRYTKAYTEKDFPLGQTDIYLLPTEVLGLPPATDKRMVMGYTTEDFNSVDCLLRTHRVGPKFVVLAPLTTWPSKCWPEERWSSLGNALVEQGNQVVLIGTKGEAKAVERVAAGMQASSVMLAGALSFREVGALIARAELCISSDSGPMHVAAAVNTPYVSLFGPTSPARWAPAEGRGNVLLHPVPCGPCMKITCPNPPESQMLCMDLLTVAEVLEAALRILVRESISA
jgi:heptosyltransferase-1